MPITCEIGLFKNLNNLLFWIFQAAEECTCVLELDQKHSGALMLRAKTLVILKEYQSALFDVTRLLELNPDSEVYHNLEARLRTQLVYSLSCFPLIIVLAHSLYLDLKMCLVFLGQGKSLAPIPESEAELEEDEEESGVDQQETQDEKSRQVEFGVHERRDQRFESVVSIRRDIETQGEDADINKGEVVAPKTPEVREQNSTEVPLLSGKQSNAWQAIPKPKGHSTLDYARWDTVEDDSSEEEDDEDSNDSDESPPQYRFRVKTVGVRPVK